MDAVQAAGPQGAIDRRAADPGRQQLRPTDDAALLACDRPNCFEFSSVSDGNSKQFAHTAIVGAHPVPAQRMFAATLRAAGLTFPR
jgi:hypothetical protein